ncbi:MAG: CTP synthase [Marinilabiliaceae bacterium]|nr:CTP synthase [Marinilabiliaceae bacterium]
MSETRYIFVTGGVASSLGKGIHSASLAKLLQARGYSVTIQKLDPYLNVDPGNLSPYEHGECFVTEDGAETDLDLGHYERFLNVNTSRVNTITTGRIYRDVIEKERRGEYLGKTVQIIPHVTDEIKRNIKLLGNSNKYDFVITEIGGTVGDIESLPYIESVRQLKWELGPRALVIHLTLVPYLAASGELKTKPTQHSVKLLLENGIQPDVLILRTEKELSTEIRNKAALFCNVENRAVIQSINVDYIYEVPVNMEDEKLDVIVLEKLGLPTDQKSDMKEWKSFLNKMKTAPKSLRIGIIGKYTEYPDSYKSIIESLIHAATYQDHKADIQLIQSDSFNSETINEKLGNLHAILVAPGFGIRGVEGKIMAAKFARENNIPFLGIGLGMQCAVIEFARNVMGMANANTREFDYKTPNPVFDLMEKKKAVSTKGSTMRLGAYDCELKKESFAFKAYKTKNIKERHRHRYEFNNEYLAQFEQAGMISTGENPETGLVEIIEIPTHKWFVGVQFHPEYSSTVLKPHPIFMGFVKAAIK